MLCLREKIGSDPSWVSICRENDGFCRACRKIDGAIAADELFCDGDKSVARTEKFIDAGNALGAVGQRGDGLCATNAGDLRYAKQTCGGEELWIRFGANCGNAIHASNSCGDDSHQQSGDERETAAGNVAADGFNGADELRDGHSGLDCERPRMRQLFFSDAANVAFGVAQRSEKFRADLFARGVDFALRDPDTAAAKVYPIKLSCPRRERYVAAFSDIGNNACGNALGCAIALVARTEQIVLDSGGEFQDAH